MHRTATIALLFLLAVSTSPGKAAVGFGSTFGDALQRAQQNARGRAMWEQVGRDMAEYVLEKEALQQELEATRQAYWEAAADGQPPQELEERYWDVLWQRDFHYLGLEWMNHIAGGIGGPEKEDMGTLIDNLSTLLSGGRGQLEQIHPYAQRAFDDWVGHLKNLWPRHDFDFAATLVAGRETYAEYVERRNVAEYLFRNPNSPLGSEDSSEFLLGWLLASNSSRDFAEAQQRVESMQKVVGREGFDRAAAAARDQRLVPKDIQPKSVYDPSRVIAHANQSQALDWVATQHDPDLYAIYLIRRTTGGSWEWSAAVHGARQERLGRTAEQAVAQAFAAAADPAASCVGEPNLQDAKSSRLVDCVSEALGPQTLWADALDVAVAEMDSGAQQQRLLGMLRATEGGDAAQRYAQLTTVLDETVLLAALHHQQKMGFASLVGRPGATADWEPFQEELRIFELFAAARDPRGLGAALLAQLETDENRLLRLEAGIDAYQERVASLGEERLVAAAEAVAAQAPANRGLAEHFYAFRREIGEGAEVDAEYQQLIRQGRIESVAGKLRSWIGRFPLGLSVARHYTGQGLSLPEAEKQAEAHGERAADAFQRSVAAYEKFQESGLEADRRAGDEARRIVFEEIAFAEGIRSAELATIGKELENSLEGEVREALDSLANPAPRGVATDVAETVGRGGRDPVVEPEIQPSAGLPDTRSAHPEEAAADEAPSPFGAEKNGAITPEFETGNPRPTEWLTFGDPRAGRLAGGQATSYRIEIPNTAVILFDIVSANAPARYSLQDPAGKMVFSNEGSDDGPHSLEVPGAYELRVESLEERPVSYELRLIKLR